MPASQPLVALLNGDQSQLSKQELAILEAELFSRIYEELREIIKSQNKDYYRLLKINKNTEMTMLDANFLRCIINDILSTEEYTLPGIAYYTDTPEEIIYEVASGSNINPTLALSLRIIELHRTIRPALYHAIICKIRKSNEGGDLGQLV